MPAFSKPYRNLETEKPLNKAHLLREISSRTHIRETIVEEILTTFREVATEEIVNKGKFNFFGLFSIDNFFTKETKTGFGLVPARRRLRAKISDRVKKLWNGKERENNTDAFAFLELMERYGEAKGNELRDSIGLLPNIAPTAEKTGNPLLDDDDDY